MVRSRDSSWFLLPGVLNHFYRQKGLTPEKSQFLVVPPETNIAPENGRVGDYFHFGKAYF